MPIEEKISIICKDIYGADGIELSETARKQIETYTRQGYSDLPSEPVSDALAFLPLNGIYYSLYGQDTVFILT